MITVLLNDSAYTVSYTGSLNDFKYMSLGFLFHPEYV